MPAKASNKTSPQEKRLNDLLENTEKQLDLLQRETEKRIDNIVEGITKGDIASVRDEIRKSIEASQKRYLDKQLAEIQRAISGLIGGGLVGTGASAKTAEDFSNQLISNLSLNQYALGLQQLIQKGLRNL